MYDMLLLILVMFLVTHNPVMWFSQEKKKKKEKKKLCEKVTRVCSWFHVSGGGEIDEWISK